MRNVGLETGSERPVPQCGLHLRFLSQDAPTCSAGLGSEGAGVGWKVGGGEEWNEPRNVRLTPSPGEVEPERALSLPLG